MQLMARDKAEASKEQSEFYSEQKMRILYPGLFGNMEEITLTQVKDWVQESRLTYGQAYDLMHTWMSLHERADAAALKTTLKQAEQNALMQIEDLDVPSQPIDVKRLFQMVDGQLHETFWSVAPDIYAKLRKELVERLSPNPQGWRANPSLKEGWETYLAEQDEDDFYSMRTHKYYSYGSDLGLGTRGEKTRKIEDDSRQSESFARWKGIMLQWLAIHPQATEQEMRAYGDGLRLEIQQTEIGEALDRVLLYTENHLRAFSITK
jgi:hypothetical protein